MTAPPAGVLEELDGGPIRSRPAPRVAISWPRAMAAASVVAASRPRLWAFALLAFLARGGLVVLLAPMLVLPTFVGISNTVGPTSVTAAGPTPRLIALVATWVGMALVAIVGGTLIGAAAEVALHRSTIARPGAGAASMIGSRPTGPPARSSRGATLRIAAVRLVLLIPVGIALAVAVPAWVEVAYRELLLPSDLAVPLPVRVIAGAPVPAVVVLVTWLAVEVLGGLAARRIALAGSSVAGALNDAAGQVLGAPITTILTLAVTIAGTVLVVVPVVVVVAAAWDRARIALVDGTSGVGAIVATLVLVAAWAACLAAAGIAAAWRSVLWTFEMGRRRPPD